MKKFPILVISCILTSCNLFHYTPEFEMERMAEDILTSKSGNGISIKIEPIEEKK